MSTPNPVWMCSVFLLLAMSIASPAVADFTKVDDFESYSPGPIAGKGHWSATAHPTFEVAIDATDATNQVLNVLDNESGLVAEAFNDDPKLIVSEGTSGTLFFRLYFDDPASHVNLGLSDLVVPTTSFDDFEVQLRSLSNLLDVRDATEFENAADLDQGEWYSVWIVVHNDTDQWELYIQDSTQFPTQTMLTSGSDPIDFRNGTNQALRMLSIRSCASNCLGLQHFGPWYIDDVHFDGSGRNLSTPSDEVIVSLQDLVQLPPTPSVFPSLARLNFVREPPDASGRLFVNDLNGPFYAVDDGTVHTYMDFSNELPLKTVTGLASGFVSFAFDPEFATNGLFYTVHTEFVGSTPANFGPAVPLTLPNEVVQHSVLLEWQAENPADNTFTPATPPAGEVNPRELMRVAAPHVFHNLGEVAFNPNAQPGDDDYRLLYIGSGDFGSIAIAEPQQLQRLDSVYGCVLRIDPSGDSFERDNTTYSYGIPSANPFANDDDPDTLGEIFAYGFRNPHRLAWDTEDGGDLYVMDIGEDAFEEINRVVPGGNYGWPLREGNMALDPLAPAQVFALPKDDFGFRYPVAQYGRTRGRAIAGGFPYRGSVVPELNGKFVFGDIVRGEMFYAHIDALIAADDGDPRTMAPIFDVRVQQRQLETVPAIVNDALGTPGFPGRVDLRLGKDRAGELYVTTKRDGFIRTIPEPPGSLLKTGALLGLAWLRTRGGRRRG